MISFSFSVDGVETFSRAFNRIEAYISDFRNVWPNVAKEFYSIEREQFQSEGAKGASGKWAKLSPNYEKFKVIKFPGAPILQATHSLVDAMTSPDALNSVFIPGKEELVIGGKGHGIFHQRGSARMPARPPISMTDESKRRLQKAIQLPLVQFIRKQGFDVREAA